MGTSGIGNQLDYHVVDHVETEITENQKTLSSLDVIFEK